MQTLVDLLNDRVLSEPNTILYRFLRDGQEPLTLTAAELYENALALASQLTRYTQPGQCALIACADSIYFIKAFFGCLYAGIVAVPSAPAKYNDKTSRFIALVQDCRPQLVITETINIDLVATLCASVGHSPAKIISADNIPILSKAKTIAEVAAENVAFIQYTSGTTHSPRGAVIRHRNVMKNLQQLQDVFQYGPNTTGLTWLPPYHDMGLIGGILHALYAGASLTFMEPTAFSRNPLSWLKNISDWKITATGGPNFAYQLCVKAIETNKPDQLDLSDWHIATIGAEPPLTETMKRFSAAFKQYGFSADAFYTSYGLSEGTLCISAQHMEGSINGIMLNNSALTQNRVVLQTHANRYAKELVSSGKLANDISVKIVDPVTLRSCAYDRVGEIWIKGANIAEEFFNNKVLSRSHLQAYLADDSDGPYLRTGDLGFLYKDELFITGRYADLIVLEQGFYYPQWFEQIASESDPSLAGAGCAAFAIDKEGDTQVIVAQEVKLGSHRHIDISAVHRKIHQRIKSKFGIDNITILLIKPLQLPRTSSGKIQRYQCRLRYLNNSLGDIALLPTRKEMEV